MLRDHATHTAKTIGLMLQRAKHHRCEAVVTTLKDWMKISACLAEMTFDIPFCVPVLEVEPIDGEGDLQRLILDAAGVSQGHFTAPGESE
jgi:tetraacyldisaccharide-1-P 4'-kinase